MSVKVVTHGADRIWACCQLLTTVYFEGEGSRNILIWYMERRRKNMYTAAGTALVHKLVESLHAPFFDENTHVPYLCRLLFLPLLKIVFWAFLTNFYHFFLGGGGPFN